jgi:cell division protein FtsB
MNVDDREFQKLLAGAIDREKQAYRRATYLTAIPVLIGLIIFSFFTYRAIRLRREASSLDQQIQLKTRQLETIRRDEAELGEELSKVQDELEKSRVGWRRIAAGEGNPRREATETLKEIGTSGPWAVAVAAVKDLESARSTAAKAQRLSHGQTLICQREGWWRVITVFSKKSEAQANVGRIRLTFPEGDSAIRDMGKWCPGRTETEPGMCNCPNQNAP